MDEIPEELWRRETRKHTFDEILMTPVPAGEPATLEHLRRDYVAHLQHHVEQVTSAGRSVIPTLSARGRGRGKQ